MNTDIHRLLDEAFTGVEMTPDAQDLKEEVRANLVARVGELEAGGVAPAEAAQRAIAELGDVRELLGEPAASAQSASPWSAEAMARHRVKPKPAFVVRAVVLSVLAAAALVVLVQGAFAIVPVGLAGLVGLGLAVSAPLGFVTADALRQETTTDHPLPTGRAAGFGLATFGVLEALALGAAFIVHSDAVGLVIGAALLLVASIALFSWLGATQTNRTKAWVRQSNAATPNRFDEEPETAARFGIYTAVIWVVTFAVMVVLIFTVGWWWAILALVGGFATMMLVLARMLFGARKTP